MLRRRYKLSDGAASRLKDSSGAVLPQPDPAPPPARSMGFIITSENDIKGQQESGEEEEEEEGEEDRSLKRELNATSLARSLTPP